MVVVVIEHNSLLLSSFSLCSLELEVLWLVLGPNPSQPIFFFLLFFFKKLCYFVGFCGMHLFGVLLLGPLLGFGRFHVGR